MRVDGGGGDVDGDSGDIGEGDGMVMASAEPASLSCSTASMKVSISRVRMSFVSTRPLRKWASETVSRAMGLWPKKRREANWMASWMPDCTGQRCVLRKERLRECSSRAEKVHLEMNCGKAWRWWWTAVSMGGVVVRGRWAHDAAAAVVEDGRGREMWSWMAWWIEWWISSTETPSSAECSQREADSPLLQTMNCRVLSYHLLEPSAKRNSRKRSSELFGCESSRQTMNAACSIA